MSQDRGGWQAGFFPNGIQQETHFARLLEGGGCLIFKWVEHGHFREILRVARDHGQSPA
jgi:hypothetical protein